MPARRAAEHDEAKIAQWKDPRQHPDETAGRATTLAHRLHHQDPAGLQPAVAPTIEDL
ncbi:hypothetical protein ACFW1M_02385 [Streptomyces inhibens]|uniref:hypothetical protein n=1 Tax=Streptomyces inhibens TaxID=2293571 RepID=UPI00369CD736